MINKIICGDALEVLKTMPDGSVDCVITSPPYWGLRDYGVDGQIGLEKTPEEYVSKMVDVFGEVKRVMKKDGTCWLNLGDSYGGSGMGFSKGPNACDTRPLDMRPKSGHSKGKYHKQLIGIPWRVAFSLQADGWYLRQDIIWAKPNPMPESVTDRCTKSHEYIFLLTKSAKYYFDAEAIKEPSIDAESYSGRRFRNPDNRATGLSPQHNYKAVGKKYELRNKRSVWTVNTQPYKEAHFATFPEKLIEPMVMAGCKPGGIVLDPFMGTGTVAFVAKKHGKNFIGIELNPDYVAIANKRIASVSENLFKNFSAGA